MKYSAVRHALEDFVDRQQAREQRRKESRAGTLPVLQPRYVRESPARRLPKQENELASQKTLGSQSSLSEELVWKNPSRRY